MNEKIDVTVKGLAPFKKFCMTLDFTGFYKIASKK